jgi:hypothetical protein
MVKYLYTFEKQKINLFFNNIFQDIYIYILWLLSYNIWTCLSKVVSIWICFSDTCLKSFTPFFSFSVISEGVSLKDLVLLPLTLRHVWLILWVPPRQIQWTYIALQFLPDRHERHHHHRVFYVFIISMSVHFRINFVYHPPIFHAFMRIT